MWFDFQWAIALGVATLVAVRGWRKGSLDASGAAVAEVVGFLALGSGWVWGIVLLSFYFSGSAFTKHKASLKAKYDLEYKGGEGHRNWAQVLATAGVGTAILVYGLALHAVDTLRVPAMSMVQCAAPKISYPSIPAPVLLIAYVASYAMVCGDTWASELGILSTGEPVLVTALLAGRIQRVPRGTNGGISAWGTLMSAAGGLFIGVVTWLCLAVDHGQWTHKPLFFPCLGLVSGLLGSMIDSVLGAVVQRSWVHVPSGKATSRIAGVDGVTVTDTDAAEAAKHTVPGSASIRQRTQQGGETTNAHKAHSDTPTTDKSPFRVVCGWDVLTNEQVNLVSAALTAILVTAGVWPFIGVLAC